jgi:MFS superfamily sulfate permease-like transporter
VCQSPAQHHRRRRPRSAQPHDAVLGWADRLGRYGNCQVHRSARMTPGIVIYRLDDRLFFAKARYVKGRVLEAVRGATTRRGG